jgi:flavin reductase (DIM6/NTAB) family NADH-FMN oxidoreductase RutF
MTLNLAVQVATDPRLVGVAVETGSRTHGLLAADGHFALSILARTDREVVRKFVKPDLDLDLDGAGVGTMNGVPVRPAPVSGAPLLERAAGFLDCGVRHRLDFPSHSFFVGEVLDAGFGPAGEEAEILRMEDTRMHYGG